jgi:hypothetical protein
MVDPISSRLDSEAVAGQNATSWFERSIPALVQRPIATPRAGQSDTVGDRVMSYLVDGSTRNTSPAIERPEQ